MIRIVLRVRDKNKIENLERYGSIIYVSPILNIIGLQTKTDFLAQIASDSNVISLERESEGRLLLV